MRNYVESSEFAQLQVGGAPEYLVSCVYYKAGRTFKTKSPNHLSGSEMMPFIKLRFDQRD
jgi:hypothetical protein